MKNINIYFGYLDRNWYSKFTYWLCRTFPFIPSISIKWNMRRPDGSIPVIQHQIYIDVFKTLHVWTYYSTTKQWNKFKSK